MTLVSTSLLIWPGHVHGINNTPAFGTGATVDAAGEYEAGIFVAQEAMTISYIGLRTGTVTAAQIDIRVETVDTAGLPSGSLWAANTNIVTTAAGGVGGTTLATNAFTLWALTAPASIAMGQIFCIKMAYSSGTSAAIQKYSTNYTGTGLPYAVANTGTPTKTGAPAHPWVLGSGATTFYRVWSLLPALTITTNTVTAGSGVAAAMRFQVPFKCRCVGIVHWNSTSTGDLNAILQDDSNNELSSTSTAFDGDQMANVATASNRYFFDNPVTLNIGTTYKAVLDPQVGSISTSTFTLPTTVTDYLAAWPGGVQCYYSTRSGTTWTDDNTKVPMMDILIDQVDDGASVAAEPTSVNVVQAHVGVLTNTIGY